MKSLYGLLISTLFAQALVGQSSVTFHTQAPMPPTNVDPNAIPQEKIVIEAQGKPVGYLNYTAYHSSPHTAGIYNLYIDPSNRGHGYARTLLTHTLSYLEKKGYNEILITPGPFEYFEGKLVDLEGEDFSIAQERLIRLYKTVGFVPDQRYPKDLIYIIPSTPVPWLKVAALIMVGLGIGVFFYRRWLRKKERF